MSEDLKVSIGLDDRPLHDGLRRTERTAQESSRRMASSVGANMRSMRTAFLGVASVGVGAFAAIGRATEAYAQRSERAAQSAERFKGKFNELAVSVGRDLQVFDVFSGSGGVADRLRGGSEMAFNALGALVGVDMADARRSLRLQEELERQTRAGRFMLGMDRDIRSFADNPAEAVDREVDAIRERSRAMQDAVNASKDLTAGEKNLTAARIRETEAQRIQQLEMTRGASVVAGYAGAATLRSLAAQRGAVGTRGLASLDAQREIAGADYDAAVNAALSRYMASPRTDQSQQEREIAIERARLQRDRELDRIDRERDGLHRSVRGLRTGLGIDSLRLSGRDGEAEDLEIGLRTLERIEEIEALGLDDDSEAGLVDSTKRIGQAQLDERRSRNRRDISLAGGLGVLSRQVFVADNPQTKSVQNIETMLGRIERKMPPAAVLT